MSFTTNIQLMKTARKFGINLNGIYMKDELPSNIYNGGYIINLQDSTEGSGTHWVAVWIEKGACYFDSFGIDPPVAVMQWLRNITLTILVNHKQIQNINSGWCGQYCIVFLKYMTDNKSDDQIRHKYKKFLDMWDKPDKNLPHLKYIIQSFV